jgi:hypothetical protein
MGEELRHAIDSLAEETRAAHKRFDEQDRNLQARIDSLTGAIGQLITRMGIPPQA